MRITALRKNAGSHWGIAATGVLLVVVYTWTEVDPANVNVRMISARRATTVEQTAYEDLL
jgi:uncharacterized DUF497 family protein